jgi:hypothetical protein
MAGWRAESSWILMTEDWVERTSESPEGSWRGWFVNEFLQVQLAPRKDFP